MSAPASGPGVASPRLLGQLRQAVLERFGRPEPGARYAEWALRYILFHGKRHPREMGAGEVVRYLQHVAHSEKEPLNCVEQAHEALTFFYEDVLHVGLGEVRIPEPPKLLDRVRHAGRVRHFSPRTEECYVTWVTRFIRLHGVRHPNTMGGPEIEMFLTDLAVQGRVSASRRIRLSPPCCFCTRRGLGCSCRG